MPQMSSNLMCPACLEHTFYQRNIAETLEHAIVSDGRFADTRNGIEYFHPQPITRIAPNIALDATFIFGEMAPHQGIIAAPSGLVEELNTQLTLSIGRLGNKQQTAGVFIDTMYQANLGVVGIIRRQVFQMPGNGIHQRAMEVSSTRMDNKSSGFIDYQQLSIFVNDVQRDVFGLDSAIVSRAVKH